MLKLFGFGILSAVTGGVVGFLIFCLLVRHTNRLDGPGGGMAVFPLVLSSAIGFGICGFIATMAILQKRQESAESDATTKPRT